MLINRGYSRRYSSTIQERDTNINLAQKRFKGKFLESQET